MSKLGGIAACIAIALAAPALPQAQAPSAVKEGVDAWTRGDYDLAVEKWRGPAIAGDPDAQFNLGQAYKLGRGVRANLDMAEEWYRKAALQGHPQAEDNYGLALFQNNKRDQAVQWLEKSADRGEPRAQYVLGTMYFNGDSVKKDWVRAYALMVRASAAGLPQASKTLAQMDRYIGLADRRAGLDLAKQYEARAARPQLPTEVAAKSSRPRAVERTELPASAAAEPPSPAPKTPPRAAPKPAAPVRDGGWRIQLGAFRDPGNARSLWGDVAGMTALDGRKPYYVKAGSLTKLLIGPYASSREAARACATMKRSGRDCLEVRN